MKITMLNGIAGLGCTQCKNDAISIGYRRGNTYGLPVLNGFGAVGDYDVITIGGKQYTVNQIIDKTVYASRDTKIYSGSRASSQVLATIKAGQPIGKVYSYLLASSPNTDGRSWLMFDNNGQFYFAPNEAASGTGLDDQGALTVEEELKRQQEELLRQNDPWGYYLKKYALPALLIIGGIVIVGGVAKEAVRGSFSKKEKEATI